MVAESFLSDPAFASIPKNKESFLIWRVENLKLVPVAYEHYGKFCKGDSYIVYSATEAGKTNKSNLKTIVQRGSLEIHIHFWLGSETSQDEAGVAAIKSIELDNELGGGPIQHRETENNESNRFLSYFGGNIRYLNGGVASGFKHAQDFTASLYHVKGKRRVVVSELPQISWEEMNEGDVYVLDTKQFIYVWTGRYSNNYEKITAAKFATTLKGEHGCGHVVIIEDGNEHGLSLEEGESFEAHLPLNRKQISSLEESPPDESVIRRLTSEMKLFLCSDESGTLKVTEIKHGPLSQKDLGSDDSYIIDNGAQGVWVWVGKRASKKEREEALRNAQGFITKKGYPANTQVTRVIDGGESADFKTLFQDWTDKHETIGYTKRWQVSRAKPTVQTKFDATSLHQTPSMAAKTQMVDDGKGQKEIWRVKKFDIVEVPERSHGEFFMGDCYLILYAYKAQDTEQFIIYYWIGSEASVDEAGTVALKAVELDDRLHGRATQVRVTQGKESKHFMSLFDGKMIIYEGGYASSFDGVGSSDVGRKSAYMLQVRGTSARTTKAIEVDMRAGCLNSNDCFIVTTPAITWIWCGRGSTGDEREMAKQLARSRGETELLSEGREKADFWNVLGGKEPYASTPKLMESEDNDIRPPRLFQCSNALGVLNAEEILNFDQSDLIDDDVMILDAWESIFLWIGKNANKQEKDESEKLAFEYLRTDPAGRSQGTPVLRIKQGFEPPNFTGFFGAWNNNLWNDDKTYQDISKQLEEASPGATVLVNSVVNGAMMNGGPRKTHPIASLVNKTADLLPIGVDPTKKEKYLCDADFVKLLGTSREKFDELPQWKRLNLKKKANIF